MFFMKNLFLNLLRVISKFTSNRRGLLLLRSVDERSSNYRIKEKNGEAMKVPRAYNEQMKHRRIYVVVNGG